MCTFGEKLPFVVVSSTDVPTRSAGHDIKHATINESKIRDTAFVNAGTQQKYDTPR